MADAAARRDYEVVGPTPSEELKRAVDAFLRDRLARFGYRGATVTPTTDHDGDQVLYLDVDYEPVPEPIDTKIVSEAGLELQGLLRELNEDRFMHLVHHFSDDQPVKGYR